MVVLGGGASVVDLTAPLTDHVASEHGAADRVASEHGAAEIVLGGDASVVDVAAPLTDHVASEHGATDHVASEQGAAEIVSNAHGGHSEDRQAWKRHKWTRESTQNTCLLWLALA